MKTKIHASNRKCVPALILTLIVCSLAPSFSASSAKAQDGPFFSEETRFTLCPFSVNGSFGYAPQSYVAGYMTNDSLSGNPGREPGGAAAASVTVSFNGTDKSVVQSDNFLAAGICAQGPDTRKPPLVRIDWGYTLVLVLDGAEDDPYIVGAVWKIYEWGRNGLWPLEPPDVDLADNWTWSYPEALTIDSEVTLTMEWNSSHLNYFATIGGVNYSLSSYAPEPEESHYFMLGTCDRKRGTISLGGTVKWFQFPGAFSAYPIENTGWNSYIKSPSFRKMEESAWRYVEFAHSVDGDNSWLDHTVRWGGYDYQNVDANCSNKCVTFYPTSGSTLDTGRLLWAPRTLFVSATPGGATEPDPGIYGCRCDEWVTLEAFPDSDYDFQYWLLDGDEVYNNPITIMMVCNRTLEAHFIIEDAGGGSSCPYVYTWNGQRCVMDNNLLPASEINTGDVEDYYRLEQLLVPTDQGTFLSVYSLQIREFENGHDYSDQVKLLTADHSSDVNGAVTPYGEILTYGNPNLQQSCPAHIRCRHSYFKTTKTKTEHSYSTQRDTTKPSDKSLLRIVLRAEREQKERKQE